MANRRSGAPTWFKLIVTACRLSHNTAFWAGYYAIVGNTAGTNAVRGFWETFCVAFEALAGADDNPFQIDATPGEFQDQPGV